MSGKLDEKYKRMLLGMQAKEKRLRKKSKEKWFLYILKCADLSLYTGIAKDVEKRFQAHVSGKGARYTRTRLPLELMYQETCSSRSSALIRECAVKSLPKAKKLALISKK